MRSDYSKIIGCYVHGKIDRPIGSYHPRHLDMIYPINYGYVNSIFAEDDAKQDIYLFGTGIPLTEFNGQVIIVYHRYDDIEDKWIVSLDGKDYSDEEILEGITFQEQYFHGKLLR